MLVEEMLDNLIQKLKHNKIFKKIPDSELKERMFLLFNIIESIILRHILTVPLFKTDEEFGDYLTKLVLFHFSNQIIER